MDFKGFDFSIHKDPMMQGFIDQAFVAFVENAKAWDGYDEKFIRKLEAFRARYASQTVETYSVNKREFGINVLNHGDFHLKNMLFKRSEEGVVDDFYFVRFLRLNQRCYLSNFLHRSITKSAIIPPLQ